MEPRITIDFKNVDIDKLANIIAKHEEFFDSRYVHAPTYKSYIDDKDVTPDEREFLKTSKLEVSDTNQGYMAIQGIQAIMNDDLVENKHYGIKCFLAGCALMAGGVAATIAGPVVPIGAAIGMSTSTSVGLGLIASMGSGLLAWASGEAFSQEKHKDIFHASVLDHLKTLREEAKTAQTVGSLSSSGLSDRLDGQRTPAVESSPKPTSVSL